jgi:hypothetical protein
VKSSALASGKHIIWNIEISPLTFRRSYVAMFWPLDPPPPGAQLEGTYNKIIKTLNENPGEEPRENGSVAGPTVSNGVSAPSTAAVEG